MGTERIEAEARTALIALHVGWDEAFNSEAETHTPEYADTMRQHLATVHRVSGDAGTPIDGLMAQHHEAHAAKPGPDAVPCYEGDMHVPHFLPNVSVDYAPGQPLASAQAAGMHIHPRADGGVASHDHAADDMTHGHEASDPQNETDFPLLPVTPGASSSDKASAAGALKVMGKVRAPKGPEKLGTHGGTQKVGLQMADGDGDADDGGSGMDADDRAGLSDGQFAAVWMDHAGKKQRKLPIHDKAHASNAMSRFDQTQGMPQDVKKRAARKVLSAARRFGIKTGAGTNVSKVTAAEVLVVLEAAEYEDFEVIETAEMLRIDIGDLEPVLAAEPKAKTADDGPDKEPDDDADDNKPPWLKKKGKVAAAEEQELQVITLDFGEATEALTMGEHRQPYLVTGDWNFPDSTIGQLHVGRPELESVVHHFQENARGQDLPICDIDHIDPAFRGAAVGWVKDLQLHDDPHPKTGGPWIEAILNLNPVGETLKANDQFRYGSPTLLRNWMDPASGETYPLIAAGVDVRTRGGFALGENGQKVQTDRSALAWTNKPKLKQLGRIAASEDGTEVIVLAMADGQPKTTTKKPAQAEPDADDQGQVTQVAPKKVEEHQHRIWHYSEETHPAKVARALSLNDPVGNATTAAIVSSIDQPQRSAAHMGDTEQTEVQASEATPPDATPPPASAPVETPAAAADAAGAAAEMQFSEAERRTLMQRVEAAETAVAAATEEAKRANQRADLKELAEKQAVVIDRAGFLLRTGRIDHDEHVSLTEAEHVVYLAENPEKTEWMLKMLENRPASFRVPLGEIGSGLPPDPNQVDAVRLAERTKEIVANSVAAGKPIDAIAASRQSARELAPSIRPGVSR